MRYLVDGYNLMYVSEDHQPFRNGMNLEACRTTLLEKLGRFAAAEARELAVIFDGPSGSLPTRVGPLEVAFAGGRGGADAEIVRRVEASPNRKNLTVVTSDRELALWVRRLGAPTVRSGAFMKTVEAVGRAAPSAEPDRKPHAPTGKETEFWLGIFDDESGD